MFFAEESKQEKDSAVIVDDMILEHNFDQLRKKVFVKERVPMTTVYKPIKPVTQ